MEKLSLMFLLISVALIITLYKYIKAYNEYAKMLQEQNELLSKNCELILSYINDLYNMWENDDRNS